MDHGHLAAGMHIYIFFFLLFTAASNTSMGQQVTVEVRFFLQIIGNILDYIVIMVETIPSQCPNMPLSCILQ